MKQKTIFENEIEERIKQNLDYYLKLYFQKHGLNPESLKRGDSRCFMCKRPLRAYCKSLDDRLIAELFEIAVFLRKKHRKTFHAKEIWQDHNKIADFQKLGYWDLIRKTRKGGFWKLTHKGKRFLNGRIQLPKRVWVFQNKVVLQEDEYVTIVTTDPRWQEYRSDYTQDYIPLNYKQVKMTI